MKSILRSKTFWVNMVAFGAMILQEHFGKVVLDKEAQVYILALINIVLRLVTKDKIVWK